MTSEKSPKVSQSREASFVSSMIRYCDRDKGIAARMRRANNPTTEYQSWELLVGFGIDLERESQRLPHTTIMAAIATSKAPENGYLSLGQAIAKCYVDGSDSEQAKSRLRRLLATQDTNEMCRILRPILSLIHSRLSEPLNYEGLLKQMLSFQYDPQKVKARWAQEFYRHYDDGAESAS